MKPFRKAVYASALIVSPATQIILLKPGDTIQKFIIVTLISIVVTIAVFEIIFWAAGYDNG